MHLDSPYTQHTKCILKCDKFHCLISHYGTQIERIIMNYIASLLQKILLVVFCISSKCGQKKGTQKREENSWISFSRYSKCEWGCRLEGRYALSESSPVLPLDASCWRLCTCLGKGYFFLCSGPSCVCLFSVIYTHLHWLGELLICGTLM